MAYQVTAKCSQTISGLTRSRKKMELFPASHHNLSHPVIIICFRTSTKPHVIQWNSYAIASDPFYSPIREWNGSVCVFNVITFCFSNRFCQCILFVLRLNFYSSGIPPFFSHLFPKKICNYEKFSQRICSHHNINVHMFWILTKMGEFLSIPTNDKSEIAFCTFTTTPPHCTQIKIIIRFYFIVCEVYPVRYPKHTATIAWLRNENSSGRTGKKA